MTHKDKMNYDSSFSRPAGLGSKAPGGQGDGKMDPKVLQFIQETQAQEQVRQQISNLTDKCWTMCEIYPRDRLDKKQETCLTNCVNRYFDTATYIANRFMQKAQGNM